MTSNDLIYNGGINPYYQPISKAIINVPAGSPVTAEWHHSKTSSTTFADRVADIFRPQRLTVPTPAIPRTPLTPVTRVSQHEFSQPLLIHGNVVHQDRSWPTCSYLLKACLLTV